MSSNLTAQVALSSILPGTNFSRSVYDKAHMESLKKSIMDYGLLQPVGISPSKEDPTRYDLVYGYRRFLAFTELGKVEIPVTIISDHPLSVDDRMRMNVVENNQRKDVTLMESGLRWRKLVEWGYDPQPITPPPERNEIRSGSGGRARPRRFLSPNQPTPEV